MVWGCFTRNFKGPLVRIQGTMDRFQYRDILAQNLLQFAEDKLDNQFTFQQDNDPKHTAALVKEFLNPIENLWAAVEKKVRERKYRNADELFKGLQAAWESVPRDFCRKMVDSMKRRCQAVIKAKGFATKY